jgi:hypothetical protein
VPHIALGEGMTPGVVQAVIADAIAACRPEAGILHSLSLVRFHPVEVLWSTNLGPAER